MKAAKSKRSKVTFGVSQPLTKKSFEHLLKKAALPVKKSGSRAS